MFFISLMLILPFLFPYHPFPIQTFYIEWLTAALALFAFVPLIKQTAWPSYQVPTIIWLPIGMLIVMALQLAVLDIAYWQNYFLAAQYFIFAALMMLLGAMLKQAIGFNKTIKVIAIALLISGLISTIIIFLDLANIRLGGWILDSKAGAVANVGQQNHLATLLALALAGLAYLFAKQSLKMYLAWPMFIFLLSGLALTASRSAWIFVGLITVSALVYRYLQSKTQLTVSPKRLLILLVLPVLFYLLQIGLPHLPTSKALTTSNQRLVELAQKKDSPRLQLYKATWYVYTDNPLLGTGLGQMAWHDIEHANRVPELKGTNSQSHNTVLQFLAETGAIGTTFLLVCLLAFFLRVKSAPISPERWLWWLMLSIIAIHAMLEYPLWYMHYLALTALLLGVGDVQIQSLKRARPQLLVAMFTMLWAASLVQTMHDFRIIERWYAQNQRIKLNDVRFDEMLRQFKPIRAFSPLAIYAEVQLANTLPIDRDGLNDKLAIYKRLLKAYPTPGLTYNYAILLALDGRHDKAINHLKHTFMRYPEGIDQHWQRTAKIAVQGERMLFKYIKYIEHLRDGEPLDTNEPVIMGHQPAIKPSPKDIRI
ncbi:MAG: Wzy polymerase domain-containing protein [Methylophilus sp.]|nr:Wzy polymerase domain-containing protein [Methylophilus sp.]